MSAGTRSSAMTATAPASSAIRAWSAVVTSMITPPLSISASPVLTRSVPTSDIGASLPRAAQAAVDGLLLGLRREVRPEDRDVRAPETRPEQLPRLLRLRLLDPRQRLRRVVAVDAERHDDVAAAGLRRAKPTAHGGVRDEADGLRAGRDGVARACQARRCRRARVAHDL